VSSFFRLTHCQDVRLKSPTYDVNSGRKWCRVNQVREIGKLTGKEFSPEYVASVASAARPDDFLPDFLWPVVDS